MTRRNPEDNSRQVSAKRVARDANAWAEKLRRQRAEREKTERPAPVVVANERTGRL